MKNRLGCLTIPAFISVIASILIFGGITLLRGGILFNPGALNAQKSAQPIGGIYAHAELSTRCASCHPAPWQSETMSELCVACHTDVGKDPTNFHQVLLKENTNCRICHTDHRGASESLTIMDSQQFPHDKVGYSLNGHQKTISGSVFTCSDCHGEKTSVFNQATCLTCHNQIDAVYMLNHIAAFGDGCLACHDGVDVYGKGKFNHNNVSFSLNGKHASVVCSGCHAGDTNPEALKATSQDCFSCHQIDDPHSGRMGQDCQACHSPADWKQSSFDHSTVAFILTGKHITVSCQECHLDANLQETPQDCFACHGKQDPHEGQLSQDCASCHTPDDWHQVQFDHATTSFPLLGRHFSVACQDCHKSNLFKDTPQDCYDCHKDQDPHEGLLGQNCIDCHTPVDWNETNFDHASATFPLTGKHVSVDCKSCHQDILFKNTPQDCFSCHGKEDPHQEQLGQNCASCHSTQGWREVNFDHSTAAFKLTGKHASVSCDACHSDNLFKNTPQNCYACHARDDKHQGQLGIDCAACHTPVGWAQTTFDHSKASFQLTGKHLNVNCASCHPGGKYVGIPKNCYGCHSNDDQHSGQFGTDCASCHVTANWSQVTFDHAKTSFPLKGKHVDVKCLSCHTYGKFKGTPKDCYSCHAKDDNHNGQLGKDCAACHNTSGWGNATFDHSKSSFPLTGKHIGVYCAACHQGGRYKGTPTDCYSCHANDDHHTGQFGTDCAACHKTSGWGNVNFDHANTGFPLTGAHGSVTCTECHPNGRYQGTPTACSGCHGEPAYHAGLFPSACGQCHTTSSWRPADYNGNHTFPINHGRNNNTCQTCHPSKLTQYTCYTCHDQNEIRNKHVDEGIPNFNNCMQCHPDGREHDDLAVNGQEYLQVLYWLNRVWGSNW